jgi:hypothetical protein
VSPARAAASRRRPAADVTAETAWAQGDWALRALAATGGELAGSGPRLTAGPVPVEVVVGTDAGDVHVQGRFEGGQLVALGPGPAAADGAEAAVTFTLPAELGSQMLAGELAPTVAFMQGRLKTAGDPGLVLELLALSATEPFAALLAAARG